MGQKAITIFTPADDAPHIYAEDDAQVHRAIFSGTSGIALADNLLECVKVSDNSIKLKSGMYSNQGYLLCVEGGTEETLAVTSGQSGEYRHDLVVAHFTRHTSTSVADTHVFEIVQGTAAGTAAGAADPTLTQNDLTTGGSEREEAIYRLVINGTTLASIERIAPFIGPVYQ